MKTLLDILKDCLPDGAEVQSEKETTNRFKCNFCFGGHTVHMEISKAVAPGHELSYVSRAIATSMAQIYLGAGDLEHGQHWLNIAAAGKLP